MTSSTQTKQKLAFRLFALIALALIAIAYFSPIWWVSLTAPQYPETAFPQGIRIHFHVDSVQNGCQLIEVAEKSETEALNCKHEMDAINHYVGMYPIGAGGPVERAFSPFVFSMMGVMILAFLMPGRRSRLGLMAAGFAGIAAWMSAAMYMPGGVGLLSPNYIADMVGTMDLYPEDYASWTGMQAIHEGYLEALARYFRDMSEINPRVEGMMTAAHVVFWAVLAGMAGLLAAVALVRPAYWLLALLPAVIPVGFVVEYAAWLWWFGHNLSEMAAFTVKPFMPTVFGQGKVAQFSTFSYPHYGFGLMVAASVLLLLSALIRRKQLREQGGDAAAARGAAVGGHQAA